MGGIPILRIPCGGRNHKDNNTWGVYVGVPRFMETTIKLSGIRLNLINCPRGGPPTPEEWYNRNTRGPNVQSPLSLLIVTITGWWGPKP